MFCSNCGKQLDENAKFCDGCGAQQRAVNDTNSASNQPVPNPQPNVNYQAASNPQAKKAPKKKTNIIITVAVVLCAFIIGKFVIAPSMTSDSGSGSNVGNSGNTVSNSGSQTQSDISNNNSTYSSSTGTTSSDYDEILSQAYIVHFPNVFGVGTSTASFVSKLDDGSILCSDYGYKDDVVIQMVETLYIPVAEYTDSQKTQLESSVKSEYAKLEALNCCTVKYNMGTNYYTVTTTYSNLDKAQNYSELYQANVLSADTWISMSATESGLIAQGAVKK